MQSGYHKVRLSPLCRVRKENFASCDYNVKLFQLNFYGRVSVSASGLFLWLCTVGCVVEEIYLHTRIDHYAF